MIIDLTTPDYAVPTEILNNLKDIKRNENIDGIILTWREKEGNCGEYTVKIKYKVLGNNLPDKYFSTTWAVKFHLTNKSTVLFLRKYVEPEPSHGSWGPLESSQGYT